MQVPEENNKQVLRVYAPDARVLIHEHLNMLILAYFKYQKVVTVTKRLVYIWITNLCSTHTGKNKKQI